MKSTLLMFASLLVCLGLVLGGCNQQEGKTLTCILTTQQDPLVVASGSQVAISSLYTYTGFVTTDVNTKSLYYQYSVVSGPAGAGVSILPGITTAGGGGASGTLDASTSPQIFPSAVFTFTTPGTYVMRLTMGQVSGFISASNDHTFIVTAGG